MNDLLIYLLKVIAIQGILYVIYSLFFHKSGRHAFNRSFIILTLVFSFVIPLLSIPDLTTNEQIVETETPIWHEIAEFTSAGNVELVPVANVDQPFAMSLYILIGIILVSFILFIKMIFSHFQLVRLMKESDSIISSGYPIYICETKNPFSYFKAIFIPKTLINSPAFNTILQHELVHVRKWHSLDRILLEIVLAITWFNPFHFLFRNRLIETHEFQADEGVISSQKDPIAYQEILYEQSQTQYAMASANHFKLNTIKTRIKMINKNQKQSKWHYLLILPAITLLTFSFANKENNIAVSPLPSDVADLFDNVLNEQDDFTPSIFPLKDDKDVKLTTGMGMRIHPILKVERMHEGVDFKTYTGNPILATADGTVVEASSTFQGYGKKVVIDHNGLYQTLYGHLSEFKVKKGDKVKRGDIIGATGTTGMSAEPHLHYEVRKANKEILDPLNFIQNYDFKTNAAKSESFGLNLDKTNQKFRVVIDAGHGGKDDGISASGAMEKDITLKVAKQVAKHFENSDEVEIILTRQQDEFISLDDRAGKSRNADLLISVHVGAIPKNIQPKHIMSTIYYNGNEYSDNSKKLSEVIGKEFLAIDENFKVGAVAGFIVLKKSHCPAVCFNIGNMSDSRSQEYLSSEEGIAEVAHKLSEVIKLAK